MLQNTFCHIQGIGKKTEADFWAAGVHTWDMFTRHETLPVSPGKRRLIERRLSESKAHLAQSDPAYFAATLPTHQHWRFFKEFQSVTAYLDIETTGLNFHSDAITTIALYDGNRLKTYVNGWNLEEFVQDIARYKVLVTFNGKAFDIPFIERFLNVKLNHAHLDLRFVLASLGLKGGLKKCEAAIGLDRGNLAEIDGFLAVLLWKAYQTRKEPAILDTLLAYNAEDAVNLEFLMVRAYNQKLDETPFRTSGRLPVPTRPANPYPVDEAVVARAKREKFVFHREPLF